MNPGCRPLKDFEIPLLLNKLPSARDRALFLLCLYTGFRITEALSLRIKDVMTAGKIRDRVTVPKRHMKGKRRSRCMVLHPDAAQALAQILHTNAEPDTPLFKSQRGGQSIQRVQAYAIIAKAAQKAGLEGKIGTHTARKTFAEWMYAAYSGDLLKTSRALGHSSPVATASYIASVQDDIDSAVLDIRLK